MASPHQFNDPQTYQEPGFWDSSLGNAHKNAGVLGKWFHTLITGHGVNGDITPISNYADAINIIYWALDNYIYGAYNYPNAAHALRIAAGALYGECSPQQRAVRDAWAAVNILMGTQTVPITFRPMGCGQGLQNLYWTMLR